MNLGHFNRILRQAILLPVLALLVMAAALYLQISNAFRTVDLIQKIDNRISQSILISKLFLDQETGLRGYQITSDPRFLQPYYQAESQLNQQLPRLSQMPGIRPEAEVRIQKITELHQTWRDAFATPLISTMQSGGNTDDVGLNLQGKQLMDDLRSEIDDLIHDEQQRRAVRIDQWHREVRELIFALVALALAMGIAIGLFTRSRLHAVSDAYSKLLAEAQRRATEIFESEQQLRITLSSIGDGVITCDADGRIDLMNPVAEELTGWSHEHAKGRPLEEVFPIFNETTRATVENPVTKVKRLNRVVGLANHTVLVRRDRSEISIADSGAPIRDKAGNIAGIVMVFRDVTIERKTQQTLLANEKLVIAGRLAATIAHEIHNPLDSVSNLLYLIRTGSTPEETQHFLSLAEQELSRVTQISRAMLGLYRESRAPVSIDLRDMLNEILLLLERRLSELGTSIQAQLPPGITIEGFPAELRQVFTNLITNAAEASSPGGHVSITLSPQPAQIDPHGVRSEPGATVRISDDGPGIPPEVQARLFQPFFTTKGENGTGLGLWVSRGIISKHGGSLTLTSSTGEDHGTCMTVFLATHPTLQLGGD